MGSFGWASFRFVFLAILDPLIATNEQESILVAFDKLTREGVDYLLFNL